MVMPDTIEPTRQWPAGGGEAGALIRAHDWASTPLGPPARWPASLRMAVRLMLNARHPICVLWGPELILFYNDAFAESLGPEYHPSSLGRSGPEAWAETWPIIGPAIEQVMTGQGASCHVDQLLVHTRHGHREEVYWTYSLSEIEDEAAPNGVGGVLGICREVTAEHRKLEVLRESDEIRRIALASGKMGAWQWRMREGLVRGDPVFLALFDMPPSDEWLPMRRFLDRLAPESAAKMQEIALSGIPPDQEFAGEVLLHLRPGQNRWVAWRGRSSPSDSYVINGVSFDVTQQKRNEAALREEKERFRTLAEGIPQLVWRSADDGQWTWASPQWADYTGQGEEESHGWGWLDAVHPDDHAETLRAWHAARSHGKLDVQFRVRRAADGTWRWHQTRSRPVRGAPAPDEPEGAILEWLGTSSDIEDLKHLQERQAVLVAELQHRTRNLIAVVRSIAGKTLAGSFSLADFGVRFDARLEALGRVNGMLSRLEEGSRITFDELIRAELSAHGVLGDGEQEARVVLEGPTGIRLRSATVQTLALALHELATNALKYGALSVPGGRLYLRWGSVRGEAGERRLRVVWQESGVPPPADCSPRRGYGRELIEQALPYQLRARTSYEIGPDGVRCEIDLPVSS
jgi:PAS domain S-box-containing protein